MSQIFLIGCSCHKSFAINNTSHSLNTLDDDDFIDELYSLTFQWRYLESGSI